MLPLAFCAKIMRLRFCDVADCTIALVSSNCTLHFACSIPPKALPAACALAGHYERVAGIIWLVNAVLQYIHKPCDHMSLDEWKHCHTSPRSLQALCKAYCIQL
jgi:hypothetical protein